MPRSARAVMGSLSVAAADVRLAYPAGGNTWAALTRTPVAAGSTVPVAVKTTVAPTGTVTGVLMSPLPPATQVPPPAPAQVQVTPVSAAGNVSVTIAPTPSTPLVFVMWRSVTGAETGVVLVALLLPVAASGVGLDTVAVLAIGLGVV